MKKSSIGAIYVIIAALLWGIFPMFTRILYAGGVGVMEAVAARAIVAGAIYLVWGLCAGIFKGMTPKDWLFELFYGCVSVLGTYTFYALAIRELSSAMAAMLLYTAPAFVIIFSRIFYGDKITKVKLAALLLTFVGSALTVKIYDTASLQTSALGILFGLLSGLSYSMLTLLGKLAIKRGTSSLQNTLAPGVCVGLVMCVVTPPWTIPVENATLALCFLAVGVIGSVLPYFFYIKGLSSGLDGGVAIILANLEPVTASLCGVAFFADELELLQLLGIAVVIFGACVPIMFGRKQP